MKKKVLSMILFGLMIMLPSNASATSASLNIDCNQVYVNETTTCRVTGYSSGKISSIEGTISASGNISVVSVSQNGWSMPLNVSSAGFALSNDTDKTGNFGVVNIVIKGNAAGSGTLSITNIKGSDENYDSITASNASKQISVIARTTSATTTKAPQIVTTKATTTTIKINTTQATNKTTAPGATTQATTTTIEINTTTNVYDLVLTSLKVDDFDVIYENGKYYVTVNPDTESVNITATAAEGIQIIGAGNRQLAEGKNVVELVLMNPAKEQKTIQVIITRPAGDNQNTKLKNLKVVGYDIGFEPDKTEYTVSVPFSTKEIYIIAESDNKDVDITGAGYYTLSSGKNEIYVRVTYGNKSSTEYKIIVKRNYTMIILITLLTLVTGGFIGYVLYEKKFNKKTVSVGNMQVKQTFARPNAATSSIKVGATTGVGVGSSLSESKAEIMAFDSGKEITEKDKNILDRTIKPTLVQPTVIKKEVPTEKTEVVKVTTAKTPSTNVQGYVDPKRDPANEEWSATTQIKVIQTVPVYAHPDTTSDEEIDVHS